MYIKRLYLRHFRNYEEADVAFSPKFNAICGDNATGKTNLLEAISLISTGRSFRTQHLSELIQEGSSFFYLDAEIIRDNVPQSVKISFDGQNRRLQLNTNDFATFHPLLGTLPSILSTPDDTDLIAGSPAHRRRFLNLHLAQSDPLYVHHLARYWRAMKQRNCLLRAKSESAIECWETEMAGSAAYLAEVRQELFVDLKEPLALQSRRLSSDAETVAVRFHSTHSPMADTYLQQLQKMRKREKDLGLTLNGPHRDDLSFWIGGKPARTFASEGQKKTAVTALRLAEWDRLAKRIGEPPLMAIDDFGGPLDQVRQDLLSASLQSMGQVFITSPKTGDRRPSFYVKNGHITSEI
jgi:DNA replication and repair protein RecF